MTGKGFKPQQTNGCFVGLIFVSSSRGMTTLPGRISSQMSAGANWVRASGRSYNGHTALFAGSECEIDTIVGWDPESSTTAFVRSTLQGYSGMQPIPGEWGDDVGMQADPTAEYWGVPVLFDQYQQFKGFINGLKGRGDMGEVAAEGGIEHRYSFKPHLHTQRNEAGNVSDSPTVNIAANCGDAAFHVLATFLYEWGRKGDVDELRTYILQEGDLVKNFSQGKLMKWAKGA